MPTGVNITIEIEVSFTNETSLYTYELNLYSQEEIMIEEPDLMINYAPEISN